MRLPVRLTVFLLLGILLAAIPASAYELWSYSLTWRDSTDGFGSSEVAIVSAPDGTLYYCDAANHTVGRIIAGQKEVIAGAPGQYDWVDGPGAIARFHRPTDIVMDSAGNLFVTDTSNGRIRKIAPDGTVSTFAGAGWCSSNDGTGASAAFCFPTGLAIDGADNLYVADSGNNRIRKITPGRLVSTFAGFLSGNQNGTGTAAKFYGPSDIDYHAAGGALYVADSYNRAIRKIVVSTAAVSTVAGGWAGYEADGPGAQATFGYVTGVSVTNDGTLYVADPDLDVVRRINPDGFVTTAGGVFRWTDNREGTGSHARFSNPLRVTALGNNDVIVSDSGRLRRGRTKIDDEARIDAGGSGQTGQARTLSISPLTATSVQWTVVQAPPGSTATIANPAATSTTFTPDLPGGYNFRLDAQGTGSSITYVGLQAWCTFTLPPIVLDTPDICNGGTNRATLPAGYTNYAWSVTNGTIVSGTYTNELVFRSSGTATMNVSVYAMDSNGCSSSRSVNVPTRSIPAPVVQYTPTRPCPNGTPGTASVAAQYATYAWTVSNGTLIGPTNGPSVQFQAINQYPVYVYVDVTDSAGCKLNRGQAQIIPRTSPTSSPIIQHTGGDLCPNGTPGTSTVTNGDQFASFVWTIQNGVFTTPSNGPSVSYVATGTNQVWITMAATDAGGCTSYNGFPRNIRTLAPPVITATPAAVCENGVPGTASVPSTYTAYSWTIANGTFTSAPDAPSVTYRANSSNPVQLTVNVTDAGGCTATATKAVPIRTLAPPVIAAPASLCENGVSGTASVPNDYVTYSWSIVNGIFSSPPDASTVSFRATTPNPVQLTLNVMDAGGCTATATQSVAIRTINPPVIAAPASLCENGVSGTASVPNDYVTYSWSIVNGIFSSPPDAPTVSFRATTPNPVQLTLNVMDAGGCTATATQSVAIRTINPPVIAAPASLCENGVSGTASVPNDYVLYSWTITNGVLLSPPDSSAVSFRATTPNPVQLTVSVMDAGGCTATATTTVVIRTLDAPAINAPGMVCSGTTGTAGVANPQNYSGFGWTITNGTIEGASDGSSIVFRATGSEPVQLTVAVMDAGGCTATAGATVAVSTPEVPSIAPSGPTTFCTGGSVTLTATAASSYLWSNGATTQSITVSAGGSYSVTTTNANGCAATSAPVNVTVSTPSASITAGGATTFCEGGSVTLTSNAGASYLWSTGATSQSIVVTASGSYSVAVTNADGCTATSSATSVTAEPNPNATITSGGSGATTFCEGGSVTLTASAGTSYLWSNGATTQSITVSTSGSYSVTVTNGAGCSATSSATSVTVNANPAATITADGPTTFCTGEDVVLTASAGASYLWSNGATTQSITVSASGSYSVTVTNGAGCSATSSATSVTVNANPTATISADGPLTFCAGEDVVLTASAGTSYLWSNGATTQSITVSASGSYSVTVTNASGCSATSGATTVTVNAAPAATITADGPTSFCTGEDVVLTASAGASYLWSNGATTQSITVSASGSYSVTVTNGAGCSATSAATSVTVNANPTATISADGPVTFCTGEDVVLTASAGTSYLWSNGATSQSITVTSTGSYSVTVTNGAGCSATSGATSVTVNAAPTATITADGPTTFCTGEDVVLTASAGASYLWSNGVTSQSITVSASGSYSVTVTNASGCSATSGATTVTVNANPAATITADGPTTFCTGEDVVLTASAGASYLWSNGATSQSITVSASGSYSVTVTNGAGCSATSGTTSVTVNAAPTATITADGPTTFCTGEDVVLTASAGVSYLWSNGATSQSITVSTSGSYSVTVTNSAGCSATSGTTSVTVNAAPTATISADGPTTFCTGEDVVLTASAGASYLWSNGATTQSITVSTSGSYSVTVTNGAGCSATSGATAVTVNTAPAATITADGPTTFCTGDDVVLSASAGSSYLWSNGATTQSITVTSSGSYSVTVTNGAGCSATSGATTVTVNAAPAATITADGPTTFCTGEDVVLTASAGASYLWSNGATSQSITVTSTGSYSVTVTNGAGCSATSAATSVTVNALPTATISAGGPTTFCAGGSVTLTASAGSSYLWSTGATTQAITVSSGGNYSVTVTNGSGCSATSAATAVTVNALPTATISAGGPTTFCTGGSVTLTASAGSSYLWSTGATTQAITVSSGGNYSVTVTNGSGCSATSAATAVTVNALPTATITAGGPTTFCTGGSVTLTASAGSSYLWSTGATTQAITVSTGGNYSVTVTNGAGCSATSSATNVTVNANPTATISAGGPTTFCTGGSVTLTAGAASSYLWSTGATTQAITVSTGGNYSVTVTNGNGCSATSAPTAVTVNALPAATISGGGPTTFCTGGSVTLTASAGSSYLWSTGATTQAITVSTGGNYSVTVTNGNGCSATSAATAVTVNALPTATISAGGPTTFCTGGSVTLTASAGSSYLWSTGATTQAITVSTGGNYSVTVTNGNGCSATSAATAVTVNALPTATISAGGPTTFCTGGSVTLTASAGSSYLWSTGATTQAITVSAGGNYSVTVTNGAGCSATSSATNVTVNALPTATISAGGPTTFCTGASVTLTASAGSSYLWSTGATTQAITVSAGGNYSVTVTNGAGCSATSSATNVTVNALPTATISAGGPTTFCTGASVTLTASAGSSYLWSTGATTQAITVSTGGNYSVTVTNGNGCSATSAATAVTVNAKPTPVITPGGPTTFCTGGSVTLTASAGSSYLWSTGAITQAITVSTAGNYSVTITNAAGCSATSSATTVTVNAKPATPAITPSGPTTFCDNSNVTLTAPAGFTYLWSNGATGQATTVNVSGNYTVTVTNASGCSTTSAPTTVTVNPRPTITGASPSTQTVRKNNTPTNLTVTAPAGSTYQWYQGQTPGSGTLLSGKTQSSFTPPTGTRGTFYYYVRVTNGGCYRDSNVATVIVN